MPIRLNQGKLILFYQILSLGKIASEILPIFSVKATLFVSIIKSGCSGISKGEENPVKSGTVPLRDFSYNPSESLSAQISNEVLT